MKELILIRHAKSDWNDPSLDDYDRPLNGRGKNAASQVGRALATRGVLPDIVITSEAVRAISTARLIAEQIGYPEEDIVRDDRLYLAGPDPVLRVVQEIDEECRSAMMFGHNPGFHLFANMLLREEWIDDLVTCSVVRIALNTRYWGAVDAGCGKLIEHIWPRMLTEKGLR